jgi:hypothetical protein
VSYPEWPADVPTTPPAWQEQEWCDGGWTCQHRACLEGWQQEAAAQQLEADQLDGGHRW